jgi:ribose-phosphate pyrophosphokinase
MVEKQPPTPAHLPAIHGFTDSLVMARKLARVLGIPMAPIKVHQFPDGETLVRVSPRVSAHAILVRSLYDPNTKLIEILLAADALRRAGARRVILVAPYLPYMRQDTVFSPGEPVSQKVIADCLGRAFDHIVTIEPHLHRVHRLRDVFPCDTTALSAAPALAAWIQRTGRRSLVVGPDEESEPLLVSALAEFANKCPAIPSRIPQTRSPYCHCWFRQFGSSLHEAGRASAGTSAV